MLAMMLQIWGKGSLEIISILGFLPLKFLFISPKFPEILMLSGSAYGPLTEN